MCKVLSAALLLLLVLASSAVITVKATRVADDIVVNGHDLRRTFTCNGNNVVVNANDSTLSFRGECNEIQVNGSTNTINIDAVASIVLESADNTVSWKKAAKGDAPKIVDRSTGNKVTQIKEH